MRLLAILVLAAAATSMAAAVPRVPVDDAEVIESLPTLAGPGGSGEERRLRGLLAKNPTDEVLAIRTANLWLDKARSQGDARYAGFAMGALKPWEAMTPAQIPPAVLVMRATVAQFLHDFDGAEASLKAALARQPGNAQAWLTLATIQRVRGRYTDSDASCRSLSRVGPALYAVACLAENDALRGRQDEARSALRRLVDDPRLQGASQAGTRQWLLTSIAEVEELAGRQTEADAAYRDAIRAERSGYLLLAYADFLQRTGRAVEVPALLRGEPLSDAVLLRLAIASQTSRAARDPGAGAGAGAQADELQARFDAAAQRPGTAAAHAREEAMFELDVRRDPRRALELSRLNVELQREPIDLLLLARSAAAANDTTARDEARALVKQMGLRDARVDAHL